MAQHTGLPCGVVLPCSQPYVTAVGGTDFKTTGVIGDETVRSRAGYSDTRNTYSRSTRGVTLVYIYNGVYPPTYLSTDSAFSNCNACVPRPDFDDVPCWIQGEVDPPTEGPKELERNAKPCGTWYSELRFEIRAAHTSLL